MRENRVSAIQSCHILEVSTVEPTPYSLFHFLHKFYYTVLKINNSFEKFNTEYNSKHRIRQYGVTVTIINILEPNVRLISFSK